MRFIIEIFIIDTNKNAGNCLNFLHFLVEATGFEPTTLWSRTIRATSCATPRFFNFLSIFVSGQTCGQATYFERFVEKYTARIVRFFKGFSDFQKSLLQDRWRCPERCALPAALRLEVLWFLIETHSLYQIHI